MSVYSWRFYSARRGVSLKRIVEEKEIKSYEDFAAWCVKNRVSPPEKELFDQEVGEMLNPPKKTSSPPPKKTSIKTSQPKSSKKADKASGATRKTVNRTKAK